MLYQDFTVSTAASQFVLSFDLFVGNRGGQFATPSPADLDFGINEANQQVRVDILKAFAGPFSVAASDVLSALYQSNAGDPLVAGYTKYSFDITALVNANLGETLRLRFAETDNLSPLQAGVDNVTLEAVPEPTSLVMLASGCLLGMEKIRRRRVDLRSGRGAHRRECLRRQHRRARVDPTAGSQRPDALTLPHRPKLGRLTDSPGCRRPSGDRSRRELAELRHQHAEHQHEPGTRVVFVTVCGEAEVVRQALAVWALGYVLKGDTGDELLDAVHASLAGHSFVSTHARTGLTWNRPTQPGDHRHRRRTPMKSAHHDHLLRLLLPTMAIAIAAACTPPPATQSTTAPAADTAPAAGATPPAAAATTEPAEAVAVAAPVPPPTPVLFQNVRVFDGTSATLTAPTNVLVSGNTIEKISGTPIAAPAGAQVIDGQGRTLMPGLIDNHVHLLISAHTKPELFDPKVTIDALQARAAKEAEQVLLRGFTAVRDLGGPMLTARPDFDRGARLGPRIYPSGGMISQTSGHGDFREPHERPHRFGGEFSRGELLGAAFIADGRDEVLTATRENLKNGATQIKVMAGGGAASAYDPLDVTQYTLDEMKAAVEAAEDWGTYAPCTPTRRGPSAARSRPASSASTTVNCSTRPR